MITGDVKETALSGLTSTLSDYDCADGELQVCHNLLNDGAGLRPVEEIQAVDSIGAGYELIYNHHTANGDVHITLKDGELYWWKDGVAKTIQDAPADLWEDGSQITSVGNILVIAGEDCTHYILWKGEAEGYNYLGSKLPELKMEFALILRNHQSDAETVTVRATTVPTSSTGEDTTQRVKYGGVNKVSTDFDFMADTYDSIMGTVNKAVADAKAENEFAYPFFVRYAYELYDGSLVMHSAPVLMLPCTTVNPIIFCVTPDPSDVSGTENHGALSYNYNVEYTCNLTAGTLDARITALPDLDKWKDLIAGVKLYVSSQMFPYTTDGDYISMENSWLANANYAIGTYYSEGLTYATKFTTANYIKSGYFSGSGEKGIAYMYLPELTGTTIQQKLRDCYNFYLFKEYSIEELAAMTVGEFFEVDVLKGTLTNIETREQMKDDYHSHDIITAKVLNTYNNRLNKANCKLKPFTDMPGEWLSCYTERESADSAQAYTFSADIYIKENGVTLKVSATSVERGLMSGYFFYPNPNAYLMTVYKSYPTEVTVGDTVLKKWAVKYARLTLKQHPFLFGAYCFTGFEDIEWSDTLVQESYTEGATCFNYPNYMYTSEVDNPFVFPAEGLNAVGNGEITAIKAATKAMSQGTAFGTNPLYAFCTDGIWALEIGSTGIFTAKQPVSREALAGNSALSATQVDNSILFLTERGLMELTGGDTKLLSGAFQRLHSTFDVTSLPHWADIQKKYGEQDYLEADDFLSYIDGARIAFDYIRYRAIVFRPYTADDAMSHTAYVYDFGSKMWGTIENSMKSVVEDGAVTYVNIDKDGTVRAGEYVMDSAALAGDGKGFYVTRPLKLGAADTLKTVRTLTERGMTQKPRYLAMWGSRDMKAWALIGAVEGDRMPRLSGTPYKYLIAAGWARLSINGDAISRLTMDVKQKYTDKLR